VLHTGDSELRPHQPHLPVRSRAGGSFSFKCSAANALVGRNDKNVRINISRVAHGRHCPLIELDDPRQYTLPRICWVFRKQAPSCVWREGKKGMREVWNWRRASLKDRPAGK